MKLNYEELEAKCAALAAELRAVEAIHNEAVFITDEHYEQCPPEVQKIIKSLAVMQIPAYQAFLAEVRAQGVEMLRDSIAEIEGSIEDTIDLHHYCSDFAAQLRKGVQS
ncbi:hypothetical protein UXO69_05030 [Enterobacter hormaechei]